jgi:probable rRNA maturation factor
MSFTIEVQNEPNYPLDTSRLQNAVQTVLNCYDVHPKSSLTIVLATDEAVRALNQQHRGIDAPTDVLSFPAADLPPEVIEEETPYLGDLVIAFPYASEQAQTLQHDINDSFALLVIHGTLHLLGYDHDTPENRAEMWAEQAKILQQLGIDEAIVPTLEGSNHA